MSHPVFRVPTWIVIIRPVRSISRKGQVLRSGSSALSTAKAASAFRSFGTARHGQVGRFNRLYGGSGREEPRCVASNGAVLHVWSGRTSCSNRQSSRASLPFHGTEALRSVGPDHPVLRRTPTGHGKGRRLHQVRGDRPHDGSASPPHGGGNGSDCQDHRDDESPAAVAIPGILRGHMPTISNDIEMKIWS